MDENTLLPRVSRSILRAAEADGESLYKSWHEDLNIAQQSILVQAGIFPFVKAVSYTTHTPLCAALIDFMVDGKLCVGQSKLEITEEQIQQATGLPSSGKHVIPAQNYNPEEITLSLTNSKSYSAKYSGLLLDSILDPVVHFAAKFLTCKLVGYNKRNYIGFRYIQIAIDVAQGVRFNWCKFIKEQMLKQIGVIQEKHKRAFRYPTVLQFLAMKAFSDTGIPRSVVGDTEAQINVFNICGRKVAKSRQQKILVEKGISLIINNVIKEHGHRVIDGHPRVKIGMGDAEGMNQVQQQEGEDRELESMEIERSQVLIAKASFVEEKVQWESEKASLEAQKIQSMNEIAHLLEEEQLLQIEKSELQAKLLQEIQTTTELRRKLNKMKKFWGM